MIPRPREIILHPQGFPLPSEITVIHPIPDGCDRLYQKMLECYMGLSARYPLSKAGGIISIKFHLMPAIAATHRDMHLINISEQEIVIAAKSRDGMCYAVQTLLQILYLAFTRDQGLLKVSRIVDYPRFEWRGLHLDESRHFFGKEVVKRYLDYMAALKLNRFHWHLSDDQGWRIESKEFPLLAQKGAWRKEADSSSYGGFYTQEEIAEIVSYAGNLGIMVIPEIDLPGHTLALLAAYPQLACQPESFEPSSQWGIFEDILCAGNPELIPFLKKLIHELVQLFPAPFFHIGGDEAPKTRWRSCSKCQLIMQDLQLTDYEELQSWLTAELAEILKAEGKELIGWDEILDGRIGREPLVMVWRGDGILSAQKAVNNGNRYILCPNKICYLDWKAAADGPGAHGVSTLENVFQFDLESYPSLSHCLGLQANLWTEHVHNQEELFAMLHPRAAALAARAWSPSTDFDEFKWQLQGLEAYYAAIFT